MICGQIWKRDYSLYKEMTLRKFTMLPMQLAWFFYEQRVGIRPCEGMKKW